MFINSIIYYKMCIFTSRNQLTCYYNFTVVFMLRIRDFCLKLKKTNNAGILLVVFIDVSEILE